MEKTNRYPGTFAITETFQDNTERVTHLYIRSAKELFDAVMDRYQKDKAEQDWFEKYNEHGPDYHGKLAKVTTRQTNIAADLCDNTVVIIKRYAESVEWNPQEKEAGYREWTVPARNREEIRHKIKSLFHAESFSKQEATAMANNAMTQLEAASPGKIISLSYGVGEIEYKTAS